MSVFLETNRLILNSPELSDFKNLFLLRSDLEVMKYIGDGKIHTEDQVRKFLSNAIAYQKKHGIGFFSVVEKESGDFIGQAGLFHLGFEEDRDEIEIAYRLHKKYWGKGYATELVRALIQWGFEHLPISKLIAITHPDNLGSQKVLKKAGLDCRGKINWHDHELNKYEIYKNDCIEVVDYNPSWSEMAKKEIQQLHTVLPHKHILDIQHIGSTAILGMFAKPIIDIQIAVDNLNVIKQIAIKSLKKLDYEYWNENPDTDRLFFVKGMPPFGEKRTHHVHIVEPSSTYWKEKILFRDYLNSHPDVIHEYKKLKTDLAKQYKYDREAYTKAKSNFIKTILKKAKQQNS